MVCVKSIRHGILSGNCKHTLLRCLKIGVILFGHSAINLGPEQATSLLVFNWFRGKVKTGERGRHAEMRDVKDSVCLIFSLKHVAFQRKEKIECHIVMLLQDVIVLMMILNNQSKILQVFSTSAYQF